jgi:hypothetical protein
VGLYNIGCQLCTDFSSKVFTIKSSDRDFSVHGDSLLQSNLLSSYHDSAEKIDLSYWDGNIVELFLQFLYFEDYEVPAMTESDTDAIGQFGDTSGGSGGGWIRFGGNMYTRCGKHSRYTGCCWWRRRRECTAGTYMPSWRRLHTTQGLMHSRKLRGTDST